MVNKTEAGLGGYLIWDFDGTLADRTGGWAGALHQVLKKARPDLHLPPDKIRPFLQSGFPWHAPENAHPGLSADEWWEDLYPVFVRAFRACGLNNNEALVLAHQVRSEYLAPDAWQCYPDVRQTLAALTNLGWTHIMLSNHVPELPYLLTHLEIKPYFVAVFNSADTGYEKPDPKAFRNVLDWIGPGANAWMIGDGYHSDIVGARQVDLPAILVRSPSPRAEYFCATLGELLQLFSSGAAS